MVYEIWQQSDKIITKIIAVAKEGPLSTPTVQPAEIDEVNQLEMRFEQSTACSTKCHNIKCHTDRDRLLRIVDRNLDKIHKNVSSHQEYSSPQKAPENEVLRPSKLSRLSNPTYIEAAAEMSNKEDTESPEGNQDHMNFSSPQEEERSDPEYLEWKKWTQRHEERLQERNTNLEEAGRNSESSALYRECAELLRRNHSKWLERQQEEKERQYLEEKEMRISINSTKKKLLLEKLNKKKETIAEKSRRLETERKMAGRDKMRSALWRQRREKDGTLIEVWKNIRMEKDKTSLEEEDKWMEELTLSEEERAALEALENTYKLEKLKADEKQPACRNIKQPALRNKNCQPGEILKHYINTVGPKNGPGKTEKASIVDKLAVREGVNVLEVGEGMDKLAVKEGVCMNKLDVREATQQVWSQERSWEDRKSSHRGQIGCEGGREQVGCEGGRDQVGSEGGPVRGQVVRERAID